MARSRSKASRRGGMPGRGTRPMLRHWCLKDLIVVVVVVVGDLVADDE